MMMMMMMIDNRLNEHFYVHLRKVLAVQETYCASDKQDR